MISLRLAVFRSNRRPNFRDKCSHPLVNSSAVLKALQEATRTIPIVFVQVSDPVGTWFVESLARPGGNITGFTNTEFSTAAKWLELLKEIAPSLTRIAVVSPPDWPPLAGLRRAIDGAASSLGVHLTAAGVRNADEIDQAIEAFARKPNGGLIVLPHPTTNVHRKVIIELAARHRLPAVYAYRYFVREGGLMSYGVDPADLYHAAATYVDRILKGAKPGELPVQQPTTFELALNLKTATSLGLMIPQSILLRAVEVIEKCSSVPTHRRKRSTPKPFSAVHECDGTLLPCRPPPDFLRT
jgi:putative ABC transport system substrate-binding protein